jgi:hypothetical protein
MLQANPSLTPTDVKAILQSTAQWYSQYDALTQGAGFLDARSAVERAAVWVSTRVSVPSIPWSGWQAASPDTMWGTSGGDTVVWGTSDGDTVVWGTSCTDPSCSPVIWNK